MIRILILILFLSACSTTKKDKTKAVLRKDTLNKVNYYFVDRDSISYKDILYKIRFKNNAISGHEIYLGKYLDKVDSLPIRGIIGSMKIEWFTYNYDTKRFFSKGKINLNEEMKIERKWMRDTTRKDTIFLQKIDFETYNEKIAEALAPPKLITVKKDTIIGKYLFELEIKNWNKKTFYGNTTFVIKDKTTKEVIQTICSDKFYFNYTFDFGYDTDFNFDNITDLHFYNGNNGGYGTVTYDYYIYDKRKKEFVHNAELAEMGACTGITLDKKKKRIISHAKSGCCWHKEEAYIAKGNKFILIKSLVVDHFKHNNVILKEKIKEKWKTKKWSLDSLTDKQVDSFYEQF